MIGYVQNIPTAFRKSDAIALRFNIDGAGSMKDNEKLSSDSTQEANKALVAKAKQNTVDFTKLSAEAISKLSLDPKTLTDKDRFVYQSIKVIDQLFDEVIQNAGEGFIDYETPDILDFAAKDLRGLDASKVARYFQGKITGFSFERYYNDEQIQNVAALSNEEMNTELQPEVAEDRVELQFAFAHQVLRNAITDNLGFDLKDTDLRGSNLEGFSFGRKSQFQGTNFTGANLQEACFRPAVPMEGARAPNDTLFNMYEKDRFQGANFSRANLKEARLNWLDLRNINFVAANLEGCGFRGSRLAGTNMFAANRPSFGMTVHMIFLVFREYEVNPETRREIRDISNDPALDFANVDFRFAKISSSFARTNLSGAKLYGSKTFIDQDYVPSESASHSEQDMLAACKQLLIEHGADFETKPEDLSGLDLRGVDLSNGDFSDCNMQNLDARGVDFTKAQFNNATIAGMKIDESTKITEAQIDASVEGQRFNNGQGGLGRAVLSDLARVEFEGIQARQY